MFTAKVENKADTLADDDDNDSPNNYSPKNPKRIKMHITPTVRQIV